jgi:hypothetical protein
MGDRLIHGLGGRCHWLDMLGGDEGKVNVQWHSRSGQFNSLRLPRRRDPFGPLDGAPLPTNGRTYLIQHNLLHPHLVSPPHLRFLWRQVRLFVPFRMIQYFCVIDSVGCDGSIKPSTTLPRKPMVSARFVLAATQTNKNASASHAMTKRRVGGSSAMAFITPSL